MQSTITLEKAKELVRDAALRFPNRVNPSTTLWGLPACVYTSKNGKSHCIAGQVLADLDLPVPVWGDTRNSDAFDDDLAPGMFSSEAIRYLRAAQHVFDGAAVAHFPKVIGRRKWKNALHMLEKYEEQALTESA